MPNRFDAAQIREALARVLASEGFRGSPRLSRFLDYVVEASLVGSSHSLKEYSIGIDVFEKPKSFDPRSDSTVRGEASKLRLKLRLYYQTDGRDDRRPVPYTYEGRQTRQPDVCRGNGRAPGTPSLAGTAEDGKPAAPVRRPARR